MNNIRGYREFLLAVNSQHTSDSLLLAIADLIEKEEGTSLAAEFIATEIEKKPSTIVLDKFLHFYITCTEGKTRNYLQLIKTAIAETVEQDKKYTCQYCGFKGRELHWLCPSCKQWRIAQPQKAH